VPRRLPGAPRPGRLALETGAPLVPCAITGTEKIFRGGFPVPPRAGGVLRADPSLGPGGRARRRSHADLGHPVARGGGRVPPPASPPNPDSGGPSGAGTRRRVAHPAQTTALRAARRAAGSALQAQHRRVLAMLAYLTA
jgi:hypothetical protein